MRICIKCGISDEKALLFDAVSGKGIVKVCRKCNEEENLPLIKRAKDIEEAEEKKSVYERVSSISGFDSEDYKRKYADKEREELLKKQETSLRDIVDRNYKETISEEPKPRNDLIDNFHWILMRARRSKKLTQQQLAEEIAEPETAIKMAEEGVLPDDSYHLIRKLENFLSVKISKKEEIGSLDSPSYSEEVDVVKQEIKDKFEEEVQFDDMTTKMLTISDLQEMKEKGGETVFDEKFEGKVGEEDKDKETLQDKKDLTDEEMDEIIFGKKES